MCNKTLERRLDFDKLLAIRNNASTIQVFEAVLRAAKLRLDFLEREIEILDIDFWLKVCLGAKVLAIGSTTECMTRSRAYETRDFRTTEIFRPLG